MIKDSYNHITDQELLDHFYNDRNNEWLGLLLERYLLVLFGVCMKYLKNEEEAKDCVQQVFLKAITELSKYKVTYFRSWIYAVARNHCLMVLREKQGKIPTAVSENLLAPIEEDSLKANEQEKQELLLSLTDAMLELSPEQRQCVTLFYLEKKSYQEIAAQTGFSTMQVKSYIQNGKRNLKILVNRRQNKTDNH